MERLGYLYGVLDISIRSAGKRVPTKRICLQMNRSRNGQITRCCLRLQLWRLDPLHRNIHRVLCVGVVDPQNADRDTGEPMHEMHICQWVLMAGQVQEGNIAEYSARHSQEG